MPATGSAQGGGGGDGLAGRGRLVAQPVNWYVDSALGGAWGRGVGMSQRRYRPLMAVAALVMALAGGTSPFLGQTNAAGSSGPSVIEVNEDGFNPAVCSMGRNDTVVWKNVGKQVHRVIKPDAGVGSPPLYDSDDILPGETSKSPMMPGAGGQFRYNDFYNPSLKGVVQTPQYSNTGVINCSALPPTPVPTPTPKPGAVPTPTPTPQLLTGCRARLMGALLGNEGCAMMPALAADSATSN